MLKLTCSLCEKDFEREDYKYWRRLRVGKETFFCSRSCWAKFRFKREVKWEVDENGCFICTSHYAGNGRYPELKRDKKTTTVARFLYIESLGSIPDGGRLIHQCRNPRCVNPSHMVVGTQTDVVKHRDAGGRKWIPSGEKHPRATLKEEDVRFIRSSKMGTSELARKFSVSSQQIWRIQKKLSWKHLE